RAGTALVNSVLPNVVPLWLALKASVPHLRADRLDQPTSQLLAEPMEPKCLRTLAYQSLVFHAAGLGERRIYRSANCVEGNIPQETIVTRKWRPARVSGRLGLQGLSLEGEPRGRRILFSPTLPNLPGSPYDTALKFAALHTRTLSYPPRLPRFESQARQPRDG